MATAIFCWDAPSVNSIRESASSGCADYLETQRDLVCLFSDLSRGERVKGIAATGMVGSVAVLEADVPAAAVWIKAHPYNRAGVWGQVDLYNIPQVFGFWTPGFDAQRAALTKAVPPGAGAPRLDSGNVYLGFCTLDLEVGKAKPEQQPAHSAYMAKVLERLALGAQMIWTESTAQSNSKQRWDGVYGYQASNLGEAKAMLHADPLAQSGIFGRWEMYCLHNLSGRWPNRNQ